MRSTLSGNSSKIGFLFVALLTLVVASISCATANPGPTVVPPVPPQASQLSPVTTVPVPTLSSIATITPASGLPAKTSPVNSPNPVDALIITTEDLRQKIIRGDNIILIDVRSKLEYDEGHLPSSLSLPLAVLPERYNEIPQGGEDVVYASCA
jgi:hypothetical protein